MPVFAIRAAFPELSTPEEIKERILDIAIQAARGLYYAHVTNMVHQDVKPGNILLSSEWDAKIADYNREIEEQKQKYDID